MVFAVPLEDCVWGMMTGFFCLNFVIYFFITWFPTYLVQARAFFTQGAWHTWHPAGSPRNSFRMFGRL
jgi:hypothetical protein